jgi:hypothetical protein
MPTFDPYQPSGATEIRLVVPADPIVFEGAVPLHGVCCVSPLQAYLDLEPQALPEVRDSLRRHCLKLATG